MISSLDFSIHTRSKTRIIVALSTFLLSIKLKNVKEALCDVDWVNSMQRIQRPNEQ